MKQKKIQRLKLEPGFIKNEEGTIVSAYLEIKDFESIIEYLKDFEKLKKQAQKKRAKK